MNTCPKPHSGYFEPTLNPDVLITNPVPVPLNIKISGECFFTPNHRVLWRYFGSFYIMKIAGQTFWIDYYILLNLNLNLFRNNCNSDYFINFYMFFVASKAILLFNKHLIFCYWLNTVWIWSWREVRLFH